MELRQFVKNALVDIIGAVTDAQQEVTSGEVVPEANTYLKTIDTGITQLQPVEFEVAVTTESSTGSEAKLNVVAAFVGGGIKGHSGSDTGHVAKLRFRIPVMLPVHPESSLSE